MGSFHSIFIYYLYMKGKVIFMLREDEIREFNEYGKILSGSMRKVRNFPKIVPDIEKAYEDFQKEVDRHNEIYGANGYSNKKRD